LRFLNLKLSSHDINELEIEFSEGLNILSISDKKLFIFFKEFANIGLYGTIPDETGSVLKNFSYNIKVAYSSPNRYFEIINSRYGKTAENQKNEEEKKVQDRYSGLCTSAGYIASSYFNIEEYQKNEDPLFDTETLKSLLINNEISRLNFPFFNSRADLLQRIEKELTDLNRDKQLLELKRMKKEKLLKEILLSERGISKLKKRNESILKYKATLNEIIEKIEIKNKVFSKINNLKKDLIELRDIKEKINHVENTLREKFSHFSENGNDQIPDLEKIQNSFNAFRDINEQIDKFSLNKKRYTDWALKAASSMIIFSIIAVVFMIFTSSASSVLGKTAGVASGIASLIGLFYYFNLRKLYPVELLDQKKEMENNLIDLLKKNNFSVENYKTGELYEILFQYFEDFINYRDISYELLELKKKISNSASLIEKEKKLDHLSEEIRSIDTFISETIENLDHSIHPSPDPDAIVRAVHDINDLLEENKAELNEKQSLISKFEEEIEEYDKTENSSISAEAKLDQILKKIDESKDKAEHIKFLNTVFEKASGIWCSEMLEKISRTALEKFLKLTDNSFIKEDIEDTIKNLLSNSGRIKNEHKGLKKYISFSIKAALSELLVAEFLPPVFIIDPFIKDNDFADNMKKLLPELFTGRQVIVILPGNEPDLIGNLITL